MPEVTQLKTHAALAIEIAVSLTPGERNIMNQSGRLPPVHADRVRVDGYDDQLVADLVVTHLRSNDHLREAELRKIGDRYAPTRPQRDARNYKDDGREGVCHPYQQKRGY